MFFSRYYTKTNLQNLSSLKQKLENISMKKILVSFLLSLAIKCCLLYIKVTTLYLYIYIYVYGKRHADTPSAPFDIGNHYPTHHDCVSDWKVSSNMISYIRNTNTCNNNPLFFCFYTRSLYRQTQPFWFRDYYQEKALLPSRMKFLSYLSSYSTRKLLSFQWQIRRIFLWHKCKFFFPLPFENNLI